MGVSMSIPYRFDRGNDWKFIRAPDWERNVKPGLGQVIALHKYLGHAPFASHSLHSATNTYTALTGSNTASADDNAWIYSIEGYMAQGYSSTDFSEPDVDYDYLSERYLVSEFKATVAINGADPTIVYHNLYKQGRHTASDPLSGTGVMTAQSFTDYDTSLGSTTTYNYELLDSGVVALNSFSPTTPGSGDTTNFVSPGAAVTAATIYWYAPYPGSGWTTATVVTTAQVLRDAVTYSRTTTMTHTTDGVTVDDTAILVVSMSIVYKNDAPWALADIKAELDLCLSQINLNNPAMIYNIETEGMRVLDPLGESVTVTHEGPTVGNPLRFVIRSNGHPWTWTDVVAAGGVLAYNLNDVLKTELDSVGVASIPVEETGTDTPVGADFTEGSNWAMMKSMVTVPSGTYTKTVNTYEQPTPDTTSYSPSPSANNDCGGELVSFTASDFSGTKKSFTRGDWITLTTLA